MAKIELKEPDGPYKCEIDTDSMTVSIKETYLGVGIISDSGERLSVALRDNGFELITSNGDILFIRDGEILT